MGIALPQLAPAAEDRVSGALVIDGSLRFNGRSGGNHEYSHLKRASSGASGGGTFTISWWAKRGAMRDDWAIYDCWHQWFSLGSRISRKFGTTRLTYSFSQVMELINIHQQDLKIILGGIISYYLLMLIMDLNFGLMVNYNQIPILLQVGI